MQAKVLSQVGTRPSCSPSLVTSRNWRSWSWIRTPLLTTTFLERPRQSIYIHTQTSLIKRHKYFLLTYMNDIMSIIKIIIYQFWFINCDINNSLKLITGFRYSRCCLRGASRQCRTMWSRVMRIVERLKLASNSLSRLILFFVYLIYLCMCNFVFVCEFLMDSFVNIYVNHLYMSNWSTLHPAHMDLVKVRSKLIHFLPRIYGRMCESVLYTCARIPLAKTTMRFTLYCRNTQEMMKGTTWEDGNNLLWTINAS